MQVGGEPASEWLVEFGATVSEARRGLDWTQRELAIKVGLNRASIANIEAGRQDTTGTTVAQLVALLGLTVPGWPVTVNPLAERLDDAFAEVAQLRGQIKTARYALEPRSSRKRGPGGKSGNPEH